MTSRTKTFLKSNSKYYILNFKLKSQKLLRLATVQSYKETHIYHNVSIDKNKNKLKHHISLRSRVRNKTTNPNLLEKHCNSAYVRERDLILYRVLNK